MFSGHMFDAQINDLSQNNTVIRIDLRGYGQSSLPGSDTYRHCDDVAAVLDAIGLDRVVIGGHSMGGAVALDFAFAYPDRVAGLVFDAATPSEGWQWREELSTQPVVDAFKSGGIEAARQAVLDLPLLASAMEHPQAAATLSEVMDSYSGWHFENPDPAEWAEPDPLGRAEMIAAPALVVFGGCDVLDFRLMSEALAEHYQTPSAISGRTPGHVPNMEQPDAFNQLVTNFLNIVNTTGST
ncbi:MAG: 3-oxoadipate enol-lactonase [Candidatus Poriferisodalaceae bacterium]|jgi:pimeloyl-ACP methyl ester carboxylesterase